MKKSLIVLSSSIVLLLVYLVAELLSQRISRQPTVAFLPYASFLLFGMSFYINLDELDSRQVDDSLRRTIRTLRISPLIAVVSILVFAIFYIASVSYFFIEVNGNFVYWGDFAIFLAFLSVFLKVYTVDRAKINNAHS